MTGFAFHSYFEFVDKAPKPPSDSEKDPLMEEEESGGGKASKVAS
jgi:hypothetical protein